MDSNQLNRRQLLRRIGMAGVAGVAIPRMLHAGTPQQRVDLRTPDCVVLPTTTAGPYYFNANQVRSDITEGRPGVGLDLAIVVVNAVDCSPLPNMVVDIWHADAAGLYSGYQQPHGNTVGEDFLRGIQVTDANGASAFETIYPGWYPGRTAHIHITVHVDAQRRVTSQLFFPEEITSAVYTTRQPYSARGAADTALSTDGVWRSTSNPDRMMMTVTPNGDRYDASIVIGIAGIATSVDAPSEAFVASTLSPGFPNPTSDRATLMLTLPRQQRQVEIGLYDSTGRHVRALHRGPLLAGRHAIAVEAEDLPSGTYVVQVVAESERLSETVRVVH